MCVVLDFTGFHSSKKRLQVVGHDHLQFVGPWRNNASVVPQGRQLPKIHRPHQGAQPPGRSRCVGHRGFQGERVATCQRACCQVGLERVIVSGGSQNRSQVQGGPTREGGHGRLWPNRLWPNRLWPIFRLILANRGLDRLWPNRLWPILVFKCLGEIFRCCCCFVLLCVGVVYCCAQPLKTLNLSWESGRGPLVLGLALLWLWLLWLLLVWTSLDHLPPDPPSTGPPPPDRPKFRSFSSLSRHRFAVSVSLWGSSR